MNNKEAMKQNLSFTGSWVREWDTEGRAEQKQEAADIRKQGCRAVLVYEENGYSIYADEKYHALGWLETFKANVSNIELRRQKAYESYQFELAKISEDEQYYKAEITEICNKHNIK